MFGQLQQLKARQSAAEEGNRSLTKQLQAMKKSKKQGGRKSEQQSPVLAQQSKGK